MNSESNLNINIMDAYIKKEIGKILQKSLGKEFTVVANKEQFTKVYGPGAKIVHTTGTPIILKKYNFAEKVDDFRILISSIIGNTLWVPTDFINIDLKIKEPKNDKK